MTWINVVPLGIECRDAGLAEGLTAEETTKDNFTLQLAIRNFRLSFGNALLRISHEENLGQNPLSLIEISHLKDIVHRTIEQMRQSWIAANSRNKDERICLSTICEPDLEAVHTWMRDLYGIHAQQVPVQLDLPSKNQFRWGSVPELQEWLRRVRLRAHGE